MFFNIKSNKMLIFYAISNLRYYSTNLTFVNIHYVNEYILYNYFQIKKLSRIYMIVHTTVVTKRRFQLLSRSRFSR